MKIGKKLLITTDIISLDNLTASTAHYKTSYFLSASVLYTLTCLYIQSYF